MGNGNEWVPAKCSLMCGDGSESGIFGSERKTSTLKWSIKIE